MLCCTLALISSLVWLPLGQWFGPLAWLPLTWLSEGARLLAEPAWAATRIPPFPLWVLLAYYAAIAALWLRTQASERTTALVEAGLSVKWNKKYLLGIQASIPPEVYASFSATGTSHILVVSGWNMSIIAAALSSVAEGLRLSKREALTAWGVARVSKTHVKMKTCVLRRCLDSYKNVHTVSVRSSFG